MTQSYECLFARVTNHHDLYKTTPLKPFSQQSLDFIDALSTSLMRSIDARKHPELMALAFWMRKANLVRLEKNYLQEIGDRLLVPRGTVFHIAPSNVDTIFIYSWFLALLSGNRNIVRLSSKHTEQSEILINAVINLLNNSDYNDIATRNLLIRYPSNNDITADLSSACDVRVIWGGNNTVKQIRAIPIPPTSIDISFANKYSLAIINAKQWLLETDQHRTSEIQEFWNDAYWFDQMGCSSPRLILWVGEKEHVENASKDFWERLDILLTKKETRFSDADYVNKLMAVDSLAINNKIQITTGTSNNLVRVWLETPALHINDHCGAGLFFESRLSTLQELRTLLSRTVQTVCYSGFTKNEIREFILEIPLAGIDRIVPFGQALNFDTIWDGFDLKRVFMREITLS